MSDTGKQLDGFIDKFLPDIARQSRDVIAFLRARYPAANLLAYDNYNALAIGFAGGVKRGDIIFSVTLYPRWVSLFFSRGVELSDPHGLLEGEGTSIRHVKLRDGMTHNDERILALIDQTVALAEPPLPESGKGELIIQSISAKQRPRRP